MKSITISVVIALAVIVGTFFFVNKGGDSSNNIEVKQEKNVPVQNVKMIDGKQIIEINARGGYSPNVSVAKADLPTILRINTNGTFDCSSSVRIPSLNISKYLPATGITDIDLGKQAVSTLSGMCGMGMYRFQIVFK